MINSIHAKDTQKERSPRALSIPLRAVIYHEDRDWLAHCLEMDIVAEGRTPARALADLIDLCVFQISAALEEGDLKSVFQSAPPDIMLMFSLGEEFGTAKRKKLPPPVQSFEARKFIIA